MDLSSDFRAGVRSRNDGSDFLRAGVRRNRSEFALGVGHAVRNIPVFRPLSDAAQLGRVEDEWASTAQSGIADRPF
jgi:hypothetical protein